MLARGSPARVAPPARGALAPRSRARPPRRPLAPPRASRDPSPVGDDPDPSPGSVPLDPARPRDEQRRPSPFARAYDAVGAWLVQNPAPAWLVNSPLKTRVTELLAGPGYDPAARLAEVERLIASDDVVVFSATYCPFSAAAKAALRAEGVPFTAVEWNTTEGGAGFAPALAAKTGRSSIPHVFVAGESVGGCNDGNPGVRPLIAAGGLDDALARCSRKTRDARKAHLLSRQRRRNDREEPNE